MNRDTYTAQATTWAHPTDAQLETFFCDADNFQSGMRVAAIIYAVGPFDSEVDWDRGCWVYEWRRPSIRIRVVTASAYVRQIEQLDAAASSSFDEPIALLWQHPAEAA